MLDADKMEKVISTPSASCRSQGIFAAGIENSVRLLAAVMALPLICVTSTVAGGKPKEKANPFFKDCLITGFSASMRLRA